MNAVLVLTPRVAAQEEMREREKNVFGKNTLPKSKPPPKRR